MKTYEVNLKLHVEADSHADVVAVAQEAIRAKNAQMIADHMRMRVELVSVADVEEVARKRGR